MFWIIVVLMSLLLFAEPATADEEEDKEAKCKNQTCIWRPIDPICASDSEIYFNTCHLEYGKCMSPELNIKKTPNFELCKKEMCMSLCGREMNKVCAEDGELSNNPCTFLERVCTENKKIAEVDFEICLKKKCPKVCAADDINCVKDLKKCRRLNGSHIELNFA